jgi:hypothetical protein
MSQFVSKLAALVAGLLLVTAAAGQAQRPQAGGSDPTWSSLSAAQRSALAPLEREWPAVDTESKQKWLELASRFHRMPPDERARVQERMSAWSRMSPQQRSQARLHFQETRQLTPQERQARWEAYQALPPERKEELARRGERSFSRRSAGVDATPKSNVVPNPSELGMAQPVAPSIVRARPGATTRLLTERPDPPPHQQTGLPKITATPAFVDSNTLLPKRGPQAAATRSVPPEPARRKK